MYVNPDTQEFSQIFTEEAMNELVVDALEVKSDSEDMLKKFQEQLRAAGFKEVKVT